MFVEYLLNLKGPVLREYFPGDVTPAGAKYQFSKKFKPDHSEYMPTYDHRYSLSGEFIETGPLPSNSYLS